MVWYSTVATDYTMCARINYLSRTDDTSFSPVLKSFAANGILNQLFILTYQTYGGWQFQDMNFNTMPAATIDIKQGQNNYDIDTSVLTIKQVYYMQTNGQYMVLPPLTRETQARIMTPSDANSGNVWAYKLVGNSLQLIGMPTADITDGLMVEFDQGVIYIPSPTSTTFVLGVPAFWHDLVCKGVAAEYNATREKPIAKTESDWQNGLQDFADYYRSRWEERQPTGIGVRDSVRGSY